MVNGQCMPRQSAYRALSDPARRDILHLLRHGDRLDREIAAHLDIAVSSVTRHLGLLIAAGLVRAVRTAGGVTYTLTTSVLADVVLELADLAGIATDVSRADLIEPIDLPERSSAPTPG